MKIRTSLSVIVVFVVIMLAAVALYWQRKIDAAPPMHIAVEGGLPSQSATETVVESARKSITLGAPQLATTQSRPGNTAATDAFPGESPDHGSENLWGMISDDGATLQLGPVAITLGSDDRYHTTMQYLSKNLDFEMQTKMTNGIQAQIEPNSKDVSIQEMACDHRVCMGTFFMASEDAARKLARNISDNRDKNGIYRVTLETDVSQSNLSRFMLITDPKVRRTVIRMDPDFRPPETPQLTPELRKTLEKTFEDHRD